MNLDADRLAKLAGLPVAKRQSLNEASNRSMHDDASLSGEDEHRFGKGQLAERGARKGDQSATHLDYERADEGGARKGDQSATHLDYEGTDEGGAKKGDQSATHLDYEGTDEGGARKGDQSATHLDYEESVVIDDKVLEEEIARMRQERLQENELRKIIRAEIGSIMKGIKKESSSQKARKRAGNLRKGVTMGMLGPGFR